jgi:tryptophan synthase alpha chain
MVMNRIDRLFSEKSSNILSVFFTAGYPELGSTVTTIQALAEAGADMVEIGMPFSDPMADGPVIQRSNEAALHNGMNLKLLFSQLADIRKYVNIPLLLMGYLNPVLRFGMENFCSRCMETGIDGVILPDLPPEVYREEYRQAFEKYGLCNILLITPETEEERVRTIDRISSGFIYMVSSSSVTGIRGKFSDDQLSYFDRIKRMKLKNPVLTGFGISNRETFADACRFASGGIIGSEFIRKLGEGGDILRRTKKFVMDIRG